MKVAPRPLFLLHSDAPFQRKIKKLAGRRFDLRIAGNWSTLENDVQQAPPAAIVLVDPYLGTRNGGGPSPLLRTLLQDFPSTTVVAAVDRNGTHKDVWTLGTWGISEVIQVEEEITARALRRRLRSASAQPIRTLIEGELPVPLPGRARALMDTAVDTVAVGGHPRDMARTLHMSASTLLRWCAASRLPTPRRLLMWMRVLLACSLLDDPGHTVYSVAIACGYSTDQALRRAMRVLLPHTPSELRRMGAFRTASAIFLEELSEHARKNDGRYAPGH